MVEFKLTNGVVVAIDPDRVVSVVPTYLEDGTTSLDICDLRVEGEEQSIRVSGRLDFVAGRIREESSRYALQKIAERIQWP